jgi:alginate O-acetyltransferase complex protein AlgI
MMVSMTMNYGLALWIDRHTRPLNRQMLAGLAVALNLGFLIYFKYIGFLLRIFCRVTHVSISIPDVALPIGISFYTFHAISYVIDVYRGQVRANKSLIQVALYISLFSQLIAGPILRYKDIHEQINARKESWSLFNQGVRLFIYGLSKKVIIANFAGEIADSIFGMNYRLLSMPTAWLGVVAYTAQIFFDFSGYSTMAIGLGKMFGFTFMENFNYPYISTSIREFWQRWHISLSTWFRDYLYIPLGGNRKGKVWTIFNQCLVFGICGVWHGASFAFVFWGLYHGTLLGLEKLSIVKKIQARMPRPILWGITLLFVMVGWVFFRVEKLHDAVVYLSQMGGWGAGTFHYGISTLQGLILAAAVIFSIPWHRFAAIRLPSPAKGYLQAVACLLLLSVDVILLTSSTYNPFIYFRF